MALFRTLPTPTNDLLPYLMVEVRLVLAPDVDFFLNSRKQGLPCWRSLSFFLSFCLEPRAYSCTDKALLWCLIANQWLINSWPAKASI